MWVFFLFCFFFCGFFFFFFLHGDLTLRQQKNCNCGTYLPDKFCVLSHRDRICTLYLLSHRTTVHRPVFALIPCHQAFGKYCYWSPVCKVSGKMRPGFEPRASTREDVWPVSTPLTTKLYDCKQELEKTYVIHLPSGLDHVVYIHQEEA